MSTLCKRTIASPNSHEMSQLCYAVANHTHTVRAAACRADKTPKKAAAAIQQLWDTEWSTQVAVQQPVDGMVKFSGFFGSYDWSFIDPSGTVQRGVAHFGRGRRRRSAVLIGSSPAGPRQLGPSARAWLEGPQQDAVTWPK
jgi:hypothetical protein